VSSRGFSFSRFDYFRILTSLRLLSVRCSYENI